MAIVRIVQVAIRKSSGGYNLMSLSQYNRMGLEERLKLIKQKKIQFISDTGQVVPTIKALQAIIK